MSKEITINLSDETYRGLMNLVGEENASQFIESVLSSRLKTDSSEIYDVKLPVAENRSFKIHSPRLANRSFADQLKIEMIEEAENGKL